MNEYEKSEYDKKNYNNHTLQTNTRHREEELQDTRKTNKVKQPALSSPSRWLQN